MSSLAFVLTLVVTLNLVIDRFYTEMTSCTCTICQNCV